MLQTAMQGAGQHADTIPKVVSLFTSYRYQVGCAVPLLMLAIGSVGKKLARGKGWKLEDVSVGAELCLAGISGALVNLFDLVKPERTVGSLEKMLIADNVLLASIGFLLYFLVLSFRQDFSVTAPVWKQRTFLVGVSNGLGLLILGGALMLMAP